MTCKKLSAFAVAVRDGADLFLVAIIRRRWKGDVYVHYPHKQYGPKWDGHDSYHASGRLHHKSFAVPHVVTQRQLPDSNFRGTENVVTKNISAGDARAIGDVCDPTEFNDVFEIAETELRPEPFWLAVHLTKRLRGHCSAYCKIADHSAANIQSILPAHRCHAVRLKKPLALA